MQFVDQPGDLSDKSHGGGAGVCSYPADSLRGDVLPDPYFGRTAGRLHMGPLQDHPHFLWDLLPGTSRPRPIHLFFNISDDDWLSELESHGSVHPPS